MEPPLKRLRLFEPEKSIAYDSDNYTNLDDDKDAPLEVEENGQEEEEEEEDFEQGDPDAQLEQTRAQLDLKLKSKFEAIFEKYGRDFTGIGDEIDLRTGEIVIDNGHLLEMEDERDDGTGRPSVLEAFTQGPDDTVGFSEDEYDEQDDEHGSHVELEDMEEDDMILFQNSVVPPSRSETPLPRSGMIHNLRSDQLKDSKMIAASRTLYPSESEILAQFGQDLGPKVARYVSQQRAQDDVAIEPAWRTPGLPLATPGKRPILKSILLQPDSDRSPSPQGSSSVWATKMRRNRQKIDGADVAAVSRGETVIRDRTWYSSGYMSTTVTKQSTERVGLSQSKRTMSVPLNESLTGGKSNLELSPWAQSKQTGSSDVNGMSVDLNQEVNSSEEKVAKFYKPRRTWSNPALPVERSISGKLKPQSNLPRHKGRNGISTKRPHVLYTEADDKALLEWVEWALKNGFTLWTKRHWDMLAEKNPRHSAGSWMNHYYQRFRPKSVIPSTAEQNPGKSLETGADESEAVQRIVHDSQSDLEENSSSDKKYHEMSQDAPLTGSAPTGSSNVPGNFLSLNDPDEESKVDFIDLEALDSALHPPIVKDSKKRDDSDSLWEQRAKPSQSPAIDKRGVSLPCIAIEGISTAKSLRSNSVPQTMGFKADSPLFSNQDIEPRTRRANDIDTNSQKAAVESDNLASGVENHQNTFSTNATMATKGAKMSQRGQTNQQTPQKRFCSSYDFSDEEDENESVQPQRPVCLQVPDAVNGKNSVETEIIDLTVDDSSPYGNKTSNRRAYKSTSLKRCLKSVSISSSSSASDLSEFEVERFFPEPTTPKVLVSDSNARLSSILGSDDFEELRNSSPVSSKKSPQGKTTGAASHEARYKSSNGARSSPAHNSTPEGRTPMSTSRASIRRRSMEASPSGPIIETPGGSKAKCGENGFRCGRGFCFKCLEG